MKEKHKLIPILTHLKISESIYQIKKNLFKLRKLTNFIQYRMYNSQKNQVYFSCNVVQ